MQRLLTAALILLPTGLAAQEEREVGRLAGLLESSLSNEAFQVQIDGLEGAFSSRAEIERMTFLDAAGPWMVIEDAILDWNRAALLRGRVEVNELAAELIRVDRLPATAAEEESPSPGAPGFGGFKLPELPVSVSVGSVNAPNIQLSPEVLGEALEASLNGRMTLADGDGGVDITVERTDIPGTRLRLAGGFTNSTQQLVVDISAHAREGGTVTSMIGIPGAPGLDLSIAGAGSLSDFLAEVQLRTDEVLRVGGDIWIFAEDGENSPERLTVRTNLDGDLRDLVPPDFAGFFGPTTSILVMGEVGGDLPLEIDTLEIEADAITIDGGFTLAPSGWPDHVTLDLKIGQTDSGRVRLPVPDLPVYLQSSDLTVGFDAGTSDDWKIEGSLKGLDVGENSVEEINLGGGGNLTLPSGESSPGARGALELSVSGLELDDEGLQELLGSEVDVTTGFDWSAGNPLKIEKLQADANQLSLVADALLSNFSDGIDLQLEAGVAISDLSSAAGLSGMPLEGALEGTLSASSTLMAGTLEAQAALRGNGITTGSAEIDEVIGEAISADLSVRRTEDGLFVDTLAVNTEQLKVEADGQATAGDLALQLSANLQDLAVLAPGIDGPLDFGGTVTANTGPFTIDFDLTGPQSLSADISGELERNFKSADLTGTGKLDLSILSAILDPRRVEGELGFDLALKGPMEPTSLSGDLTLTNGEFEDDSLELALSDLTATATFDGDRVDLDVSGASNPDGQLALNAVLDFLKDDPSQFLPYAIDYKVTARDEGIVSRLARLPTKQLLDLELEGRAAADELSADVLLKSDGNRKLIGEAGLIANDTDSSARDFSVDLRADAVGVLPQQIVDLLGSEVLLAASGILQGDGAIELSALELNSDALRAEGSAAISAEGMPEKVVLELDISQEDGSPVVIPIPELPASIKRALVDLSFDPASAGDWKLNATIDDAEVLGNGVASVRLRSGGQTDAISSSGLPDLSGDVDLTATGLSLENAQIEQFLTGDVAAGARFDLSEETGLALENLFARSGVVNLKADATVSGFASEDQLSATASLTLRDEDAASPLRGAVDITVKAEGDLALQSMVIDAEGSSTDFGLGQQQLDALLAGDGNLQIKGMKSGDTIEIEVLDIATSQLEVNAGGRIAKNGSDLKADAKLANLALLVPELPGPLTLNAELSGQGGPISLSSRIEGPAGINAEIGGTIDQGFGSADLEIKGGSRLEVLIPFIRPATASGQILLDIALSGPFALPSLAGKITLSDGRVADPAISLAVEQLRGTLSIVNSSLQVAITGNSSQGGSLSIDGQLGLTDGLQAAITAAVSQFQYVDPRFLSTSLDGAIKVEGPLTGRANISGEIDVGRTEVRLSSSLGGGGASVEGLTHVGESAASLQTRKRAGLIEAEKRASGASKAPVYGLDVLIDANNPIFIRGLGLDAEVGGEVQIGGTTAAIEPVGTFELVRGRANILGQRLDLTEGTVTLSGNSVPTVRFVATNTRSDIEASAIISGPIDDPEITFESTPSLPEDQVLAQLLFNTELGNLSGLQALQLANAVAVMRGGSGIGILGNIRDDLGIDNLDLATDEEGRTNLKVGRYINDTTYTDFEVRSDGNTAVTLNIDLTPSLTVRGIAESDGSSGGGIFFERDF